MKTIVPFAKNFLKQMVFLAVIASAVNSHAQSLSFSNPTLEPGSPAAGSNGATYRFPSVMNNVDALVKINGRSTPLVTLSSIDVTSDGYDKAFQPKVAYNNGSVTGVKDWWMEFEIKFVNKNTSTGVSINTVNATAVDLDGNDNRLRERAIFYAPSSFTLESPTTLSVLNFTQMLLGVLTPGTTFDGAVDDHTGIDTFATNLMVTTRYNNVNTIRYRAGGFTSGTTTGADRQYSVYFKNFNYTVPLVTLPIKLESFTANLNGNKADLKWITSQEINVSHFVVEKSYDGRDFSDAGIVFAYGNTSEKKNYSFSDNLSNAQHNVIYYRLRSIDIDGKAQLSEVRIIRVSKQNEMLKMITYPNPVINELRITVPAAWQSKAIVFEIFNQNGQRIKASTNNSSSQTETIMVNELAKGFYIIKATCGTETAQQKIIKD